MYTLSLSHVQTLPPTRKAFLFLSSPHTRNLHSLFFLCIHSYPHTTSLVTHHSSSQSPPWRDSTQTLPKVFYSCSNIFVHQLSPAWRASTQTRRSLPPTPTGGAKIIYSCSARRAPACVTCAEPLRAFGWTAPGITKFECSLEVKEEKRESNDQ